MKRMIVPGALVAVGTLSMAGAGRPSIVEVAQDRGIPLFPSIGVRFWF